MRSRCHVARLSALLDGAADDELRHLRNLAQPDDEPQLSQVLDAALVLCTGMPSVRWGTTNLEERQIQASFL